MSSLSLHEVKRKRSLYLAGATLTLLFLGLIYAFSMFAAPMSNTFNLAPSEIGLTFNIMMISFCIGAVAGSQIEGVLGVQKTLIIAAFLFFCGFAGTGMFGKENLVLIYICYGILGGLGVGIGYNSIVATTNLWFPDKVGFSSGVLMMGFGLGSLILGTLSVRLIPLLSLNTVLICIGVVAAVIVCVFASLIERPPSTLTSILIPHAAQTPTASREKQETALKTPTFYLYWIWATIVIAIGLATIGNAASDAQLIGIEAGFATLLVGLVSTCNGLARVIIGIIYDKTNVVITMFVDSIIAIAATLFIVGAFTTGIPALYIAGAFCCGFCYGGVPVVASAFARQRFGAKNYPLNLSLANFAITFGSLLNIIVALSVNGSTNRPAVFIVMGVLSFVALLDILPFSRLWRRDMQTISTQPIPGSTSSPSIE